MTVHLNNSEGSFHVDICGRAGDGAADDLSLSVVLLVRPLGEDSLVQIQEDGVE